MRPPRAVRAPRWIGAHKVTPDGYSVPISGSITAQTRDKTIRNDHHFSKGADHLPLTGATCRVDIELADLHPKRPRIKSVIGSMLRRHVSRGLAFALQCVMAACSGCASSERLASLRDSLGGRGPRQASSGRRL